MSYLTSPLSALATFILAATPLIAAFGFAQIAG
jgi:hypothetical protein